MNVLVIGGAGYIGSHTCKELAQSGHEVAVYDNLSTGHRRFVNWGEFFHGDILDTGRLRKCLQQCKPDGVIHFAASAYVSESIAKPCKYYRNNISGTLSILEAMRDVDVNNIVVSSTCAVYGQVQHMPITEDCPPAPAHPYGASKLFMERMLADFYTAHGLHWMSLRYFNAAGADPQGELWEDHKPETHLIPQVIMAAKGLIPEMLIFGDDYATPDGTCIRDYVHVCDLARAHVLAMQHLLNGGASQVINLGTGKGTSVMEIVRSVERSLGVKVPFRIAPRRAGDAAVLVADASKAKKVLDWAANAKHTENICFDAAR